ncbi:aminopeptidase N [Ferrimonas balearica]|uniref:aminopeptidase N n=1 Tax=Ferrimonas balearica TaxID=44012 RepID=UPI001C999DC7|nr:aminopeptidase N [Ferrimonas balearica]MBY5920450.1 aminopeptidase N [Ferrimonas balearica]MBY5996865.1 aminopeptidase N [Ferrimonas balearica]
MTAMQAKYRKDYQAPDFTITELDLAFVLDPNHTQVIATSHVVRQRPDARELVLDGESLQLKSVKVNGEALSADRYREQNGQLVIELDQDEATLVIETEIDPANNTTLEGLYQSGGAFCTQCEAEGFRRITYFLDRPDVLARYRTRIEADKAQYPFLLSNGNKIEAGDLDDGRHFAVWEDPFPKPSYLFALVAGDFDLLEDTFVTASGREVALELFVDRGNLYRGHHAMASLKHSMAWDEKRFGLEYDLDIYMIVAVDFFNMGAMENKGLNIFNSKAVLADPQSATDAEYHRIESIIGHEYFHNWTGNRVTCRDWFQLSLKEGLTVFRDQEFSSEMGSRAVNRIQAVKVVRNQQFAEDAGPMAHPIRPEKVIEMNNFYTVTVYDKGAEVIRMMHTLLGEAGFRKGMDLYFERHDGQAVTCDDFVQAMEDASGVDLTQFRLWYSQSGTPVLSVEQQYDAERHSYTLTLSQHTPPTADQSEKVALHIPVAFELIDSEGRSVPLICDGQSHNGLLELKSDSQSWTFEQVPADVVPSLLQEFSAPVRLSFQYQPQQLARILAHASNDFARWDAAQTLYQGEVFAIADGEQERVTDTTLEAIRAVLLGEGQDPALVAELLMLPSESTLAQARAGADVEAIHHARRSVQSQLGLALEDELTAVYRAHFDASYANNGEAVGRRALKNACLHLLAMGGKASSQSLIESQFQSADNMTDSLAALNAANQGALPVAKAMMTAFETRWREEPLVMDKWFAQVAMQPGAHALDAVKAAMTHVAFDISNPNRVRALIGAFADGNPNAFHAIDGSGYQFLTDILIKLNGINPQCAARIMTPLMQWKQQDEERQALMLAQLKRLASLEGLSRDLFEKVSKSLEQAA